MYIANTPSYNPQLIFEIFNINPVKYRIMTALLIAVVLIGTVVVINDIVTTSNKQDIGNSSKPNHQRVIRKTN